MARIFITGSSTGLGLLAGQWLIEQGHQVVLHGRDQARAEEAMSSAPGAQATVIGDLSAISQVRAAADQVNRLGRFDAVIHNAGVGRAPTCRTSFFRGRRGTIPDASIDFVTASDHTRCEGCVGKQQTSKR
jgi:NAD(P)-dependent dehydrogenase (short-subunit alcohol dehydrogenase family)